MKRRVMKKIEAVLSILAPSALIAGSAAALYKVGKKHGMGELCDWCENHGEVFIQNDLGPDFKIIKEEVME